MKRVIDILIATTALIVLLPVLVVLYLLVAINLGRPVFFKQTRPGLNGALFNMIKFRSMTDARDEKGALLSDEVRLTPFGKWLRSTSLDELPELLNILKGDMSLVGPRPLLPEYLTLYSDEQKRRHQVRPGITGWSQVNGRNALSWEKKFALDVWYVDNQSLWLDAKILVITLIKVIKREGINGTESATMKPFTGRQSHD